MRENWMKASGFTRGSGSVTQTTKLVTPNGSKIQQDANGNIGVFTSGANQSIAFASQNSAIGGPWLIGIFGTGPYVGFENQLVCAVPGVPVRSSQ